MSIASLTRSHHTAIVLCALLVSSVVVAPVAAAGFANDRTAPDDTASFASAATVQTDSTASNTSDDGTANGTDPNGTDSSVAESLPRIGTTPPQDLDGDGRYEDVTGDGSLTNSDVTAFFSHQHLPRFQSNATHFDFDGNGDLGQSDVVRLYDALQADDPSNVVVPRPAIDSDGDGLLNREELDLTGTDYLDPDSNSSFTASNESDSGVRDSQADFDGDGLNTSVELLLGTDPVDADTDGDGTPDGAENPDGDGLTHVEEIDDGTNPRAVDTDRDGLDDGAEVANGTDPLAADSDEDGLPDSEELTLPTDPTYPDTDGDGLLDGEETFETTTQDESTGVNVSVRGKGNVANTVTTEAKPTYFEESNASAGPTVHLENESSFESSTVEIPIEESVAESERENLSIFHWNGSTSDHWRPLETTIGNGTAVAETDSFSYFTVLDQEKWVSATTVQSAGSEDKPITLGAQSNATCVDACSIRNDSTLLIGGEPTAQKITVEQGNDSFQVVPLSNGQRIGQFYDYANDQINAPLPIAESDTSQLFFWSSPRGLSLVTLHDKPSDNSGGAVDLGFEGLPVGTGQWVLKDDSGDFNQGSSTRPHWSWGGVRTDGGAFRGGLLEQTIEITPYFNEKASRTPHSEGTIDSWQILTGQATAPEAHQLDMQEPVTVHVPEAPAENESVETTGDSGTARFEYDHTQGVERIAVRYQTEQTNVNPEASITLEGADGTTVEESLNVGTVGTVEEELNVSKLSPGVANVSLSADGVNLRAEVVPQRAQIDTDSDGLPDRFEDREWTAANGRVETFETSSSIADGDGDGLLDGEEVEFVRERTDGEERFVPVLQAHPNRTDTDGDGLSDHKEIEGWEIQIVDDHENATRLQATLEKGLQEDQNVSEFFRSKHVASNPLTDDSDEDALTDAAELTNGTDPETADTTGDDVSDFHAVHKYPRREDPTVYSTVPPKIQLEQFESGWRGDEFELPRYRFTYRYRLRDAAGLQKAYIEQNGKEGQINTYDGQQLVVEDDEITSESDGVLQHARGVDARIYAEDVKGNNVTELFTVQRSVGPMLLEEFGAIDAPVAGVISGWTNGAAELPDFALLLWHDTSETLQAFADLAREYVQVRATPEIKDDNEFWIQYVNNAAQGIHTQQDRDNPYEAPTENPEGYWDACREEYIEYEEPPSKYCEFATGWYQGYVTFAAVDLLLGSKSAASQADSADDVAGVVETAGKQMDDVDWSPLLDTPQTRTGHINHHLAAEGGPDVDGSVVANTPTAGRAAQTKKALDDVDVDLSDLDDAHRAELGRHLADHPEGAKLINELGPVGTKELFRLSYDDVDATNLRKNLFERYQHVDADTRADFAQYTSDPEVRTSFIRAVGDEATTTQAVQRDLAVLRKFEGEVEAQHFRSADEAKARAKSGEDEYFSEWYPERAGGPEPLYDPYPKSGLVIDAKIQQSNKVLVRAYSSRGSSNFLGAFFTDGEDMLRSIRSQNEDIEGTYALPEEGKDKAAIYQVKEQTTVRISTVGRNNMGPGGGIQFEVREPSVKQNTEDLTPSDFPGQFPERGIDRAELEQILEEYT